MLSETVKHTYNYQEKIIMTQVFHPPSINRALSTTHPELILGSFESLILDKIDLNREMLWSESLKERFHFDLQLKTH